MGFYSNIIKPGRKGYSLRGGPFAKWRMPVSKTLYRKRLLAGPEPQRPRSVWSNWNYDSEIFAFNARLGEQFKETLLRQAFVHPSFIIAEKEKYKELGLEFSDPQNNMGMAQEGEKICQFYLKAVLAFRYPRLSQTAINNVTNHLMSTETTSYVASNLGLTDLIKCQEFPVAPETKQACLMALVAALKESSGVVRAHLFVNDFILTQLIGKDINEICHIVDPMGVLLEELKKQGETAQPVARLMWSTGANTPTAVFIVGLYLNERFLSKGSGETVEIAEEMATRDALRRIYGTVEEAAPLPFGTKAREHSERIKTLYDQLRQQAHA